MVVLQNGLSRTINFYVTNSGSPATGLTPSFAHYDDVTDPSNPSALTQPTINEIANGVYAFLPSALTDKVVSFVIDAGSGISSDGERYIAGEVIFTDLSKQSLLETVDGKTDTISTTTSDTNTKVGAIDSTTTDTNSKVTTVDTNLDKHDKKLTAYTFM